MNLELSHDGGGLRHFLNGRPVHCGTQLLIAIHPENCREEFWTGARYEATLGDCVNITLHTNFGVVLPNRNTRLRWPDDNGTPPKKFQRVALNMRTPELPAYVHAKLGAHRGKYSDLVSVYHVFCFDLDCWAGVAGDGDNGAYEWFISTPGGLEVSDVGWSDCLIALREVVNKVASPAYQRRLAEESVQPKGGT